MSRRFDASFGSAFGPAYNTGTLVLFVGSYRPDYQDGDVLCAFNRKRTRLVHAERIAQPAAASRQANGLIATDHLSRRYAEIMREYRFERVSLHAVMRTNLWTGEVDVLGLTPNERGEVIDVERFVRARRRSGAFGLYGAEGTEIWYGGGSRTSHEAVSAAWGAIEEHSPEREQDYPAWPFGTEELKHFLAIHTDDFTDGESNAFVAPEVDDSNPETPVVVKKRKRLIPWRTLRGMSSGRINAVEDRAQAVDVRLERKHVRAAHIQTKV